MDISERIAKRTAATAGLLSTYDRGLLRDAASEIDQLRREQFLNKYSSAELAASVAVAEADRLREQIIDVRKAADKEYERMRGMWLALRSECAKKDNTIAQLREQVTRLLTKCGECEEAVVAKIRARRDAGRAKYGQTMERTDLTRQQWLVHAQEEALDLAIYLERIVRDETGGK